MAWKRSTVRTRPGPPLLRTPENYYSVSSPADLRNSAKIPSFKIRIFTPVVDVHFLPDVYGPSLK